MSYLYNALAWVLGLIYSWVENYGVAIILFTIVIKLILLPLSIKQHKSMAKMQRVRPLLEYIQKKYKDDQQRLQQETMKLYKEEGVSPAGGCLPLLLQFPILIGLYQVINRPLTYILGLGENTVGAMMKAAKVTNEIGVYQAINEGTVTFDAKYSDAVAQIKGMNFELFGIDFSLQPNFMGEITVLWLIPVLATVTAYLSSYITRKLQAMPQTEQQQSSMKTMNMIMPLMSAVFCFMLPAGVGLYWIMSNVVQIGQTVLLHKIFNKKNEGEEIDAEEYFKKDRNHRKKYQ